MNLILDSSSTINLHNGQMLERVLSLRSFGFTFHIGTIVRGECVHITAFLDEQANNGSLVILPGKTITAALFAEVLSRYELGLGETECIVQAAQRGLLLCSDDAAARAAAQVHLGHTRVLGSVRLVRESVCAGLATSQDAYEAYEAMKDRGAFLPEVAAGYFDC